MLDACIVFWTAKDQEEAERLVTALIEKQHIACASLMPVTSLYIWEGAINRAQEVKVIIKTKRPYISLIIAYIKHHGSYQVPEILAVDCIAGNPDYLEWIEKSVIPL